VMGSIGRRLLVLLISLEIVVSILLSGFIVNLCLW
jgi:hypothetical protein